MVTLDCLVTVSDDVIFQELDGEAVLLNMQSESYFGLDSVGTRIWELLKAHGLVRTAAQKLLDEYDIGKDELQQHLLEFVEKLHAKGLITIQEG